MTMYRVGPAGIPANLKTDMNAVLNKKFGTSTTYDPAGWPDDVNLLGPLPERTASGSIAHITDGADTVPLKNWAVTLPASLTGYSSVDCTKAGKNILPKLTAGTYSGNGIDITVDSNGIATFSGTTTASGNVVIIPLENEIEVTQDIIDNWYYHMNNSVANGGYAPTLESAEDTGTISFAPSPANRVSSIPAAALGKKINRCRIWSGNGITISGTYAPAFMVESTATDYEPYTAPTTQTANLGRTIYGGSVDVVKGQGTETNKKVIFNGTEQWQKSGSALNGYYTPMPAQGLQTYTAVLCNKATMASSSSEYYNNYDKCYVDYYFAINLDPNIVGSTTAQFKQWLADQYAGGTPLEIVGKLETDTDFTFDPLTPTPETQLGVNNLWADAGDSSVTYRADIDLLLGGI